MLHTSFYSLAAGFLSFPDQAVAYMAPAPLMAPARRNKRHGCRGFSLLELSLVMTIVSVVLVMTVSTGLSVIATARQNSSVQKMQAIENALMQYRAANNRLPCPSDLTQTYSSATYGTE